MNLYLSTFILAVTCHVIVTNYVFVILISFFAVLLKNNCWIFCPNEALIHCEVPHRLVTEFVFGFHWKIVLKLNFWQRNNNNNDNNDNNNNSLKNCLTNLRSANLKNDSVKTKVTGNLKILSVSVRNWGKCDVLILLRFLVYYFVWHCR